VEVCGTKRTESALYRLKWKRKAKKMEGHSDVDSNTVMKTRSSSLTVEASKLLQQLLGAVENSGRAAGGILKTTCWL
jgi:hypothetical protein